MKTCFQFAAELLHHNYSANGCQGRSLKPGWCLQAIGYWYNLHSQMTIHFSILIKNMCPLYCDHSYLTDLFRTKLCSNLFQFHLVDAFYIKNMSVIPGHSLEIAHLTFHNSMILFVYNGARWKIVEFNVSSFLGFLMIWKIVV